MAMQKSLVEGWAEDANHPPVDQSTMSIFANDAGALRVRSMLGSLRRWTDGATNQFLCRTSPEVMGKRMEQPLCLIEAELPGGLEAWRR